MEKICLSSFPTPYFLVDEQRLRNNLAVLQSVCSRTGCKILLAQKAFSMYSTYPIIPADFMKQNLVTIILAVRPTFSPLPIVNRNFVNS